MKFKYSYDTVVVGAGVSGLLTSYLLGKYTSCSIGLFDGGDSFESRRKASILNPSVRLSGFGGAGTLGGGKLCGIPSSGKIWALTHRDLGYWEEFVEHLPLDPTAKGLLSRGRKPISEITPLIGSLRSKSYNTVLLLQKEMSAFVLNLIALVSGVGTTLHEQSSLSRINRYSDGYGILFSSPEENIWVKCKNLVLATGRSNSGNVKYLLKDLSIKISDQAPDLGIRLEMPKNYSRHFSTVGSDTKLKRDYKNASLRTFCVCSGGEATEISIGNNIYFDGHFAAKLTDVSNVGIMARIPSVVGHDTAIEYCKALSHHHQPIPLFDLLRYGSSLLAQSYQSRFNDSVDLMIQFVKQQQREGILGSDIKDISVKLPAIDRYWPLVETTAHFETSSQNLFVIGDAAGLARGYVQSMWSAWCCSHEIISRMNFTNKYSCLRNTRISQYA